MKFTAKIHSQKQAEENSRKDRRERGKEWSGLSESNRHLNLGKVPYYHYTKAATRQNVYNTPAVPRTSARPRGFHKHLNREPECPLRRVQETWLTRADLTIGERRWRSAKRIALSLSVKTRPNL